MLRFSFPAINNFKVIQDERKKKDRMDGKYDSEPSHLHFYLTLISCIHKVSMTDEFTQKDDTLRSGFKENFNLIFKNIISYRTKKDLCICGGASSCLMSTYQPQVFFV